MGVGGMPVDPEALRAAVEEVITASGTLHASRLAKQAAEAELATADAAVDSAGAAEQVAHAELDGRIAGLKELADAADD